MRRYGWLLVATAVAAAVGGRTALAEMNLNGPAEVPPPSFKGRQYVDSAGCVFVRAGYGDAVNWVPRVDRTKNQLCGYTPTFKTGQAVLDIAKVGPATPAPSAKPSTNERETRTGALDEVTSAGIALASAAGLTGAGQGRRVTTGRGEAAGLRVAAGEAAGHWFDCTVDEPDPQDPAAFDPDARKVITESGEAIAYDYLVVATGTHQDWSLIEGMDVAAIGQNGLASVYPSATAANATWQAMQAFVAKGGKAIMTLPSTPLKCAGAPLKMTFMLRDRLRQAGTAGRSQISFHAAGKAIFGVKPVAENVLARWQEMGIDVAYEQPLKGRRSQGPIRAGRWQRTVLLVSRGPPRRARRLPPSLPQVRAGSGRKP